MYPVSPDYGGTLLNIFRKMPLVLFKMPLHVVELGSVLVLWVLVWTRLRGAVCLVSMYVSAFLVLTSCL